MYNYIGILVDRKPDNNNTRTAMVRRLQQHNNLTQTLFKIDQYEQQTDTENTFSVMQAGKIKFGLIWPLIRNRLTRWILLIKLIIGLHSNKTHFYLSLFLPVCFFPGSRQCYSLQHIASCFLFSVSFAGKRYFRTSRIDRVFDHFVCGIVRARLQHSVCDTFSFARPRLLWPANTTDEYKKYYQ